MDDVGYRTGEMGWVFQTFQMGVSKNRGAPKWMVYDGKQGTPIFGNTQILFAACCFGDLRRVLIDIEGEVRGRPMILDDTFGIDRFFASQRLT